MIKTPDDTEPYVYKKVSAVLFGVLSPKMIKKMAAAKIVTPELYDIDGFPVDGGLMDLRLGAIDPGVRCRTCGKRVKECPGHPGCIELARPVFHIKYIPLIELCLRSFCLNCGKLTLSPEKEKDYTAPERAKKARDTRRILEELQKGKEKLFYVSLYINCKAKTDEELNLITKKVEAELNSMMIIPKIPVFRMKEGLK